MPGFRIPLFSRLYARLGRRSPKLQHPGPAGRIATTRDSIDVYTQRRQSSVVVVKPLPTVVRTERTPITSARSETIELEQIQPPWYSRRKSSLWRTSAESMPFREDIRSPRPARRFQSFTAMPVELTEIPITPCRAFFDFQELVDRLAEQWAAEKVADDQDETLFRDRVESCIRDSIYFDACDMVQSPLSLDFPSIKDDVNEHDLPSPQYHPKALPIAINASRPTSYVQSPDHTCEFSNTPIAGARRITVARPLTARTVSTTESRILFNFW